MGCGPEWECVSGYLRAITPDPGKTPAIPGVSRQLRDAHLVAKGDESLCRRFRVEGGRADGPPRGLGRIPAEIRAAGKSFCYML